MAFLSSSASRRPGALALQDGHRSLSYRELGERAEEVARRLRGAGLAPGQTVAVKGQLDADLIVALHGVWRAGASVAPLHPRWPPAAEARAFDALRPSILLLGRGDGSDFPDPPSASVPEVFSLVARGDGEPRLLEDLPLDGRPLPPIPLDAFAADLLTSGTAGAPRRVSLTVRNLLASAEATQERLALLHSDRWLGSLSLAHVGGLALVTRAAHLGSAVVLPGRFRVETFLSLALAGSVTHASVVPTMLHRTLEALGPSRSPLALRCILVGGAPAPAPLVERSLERGLPIALTYGLTEATSQVATSPPSLVRRKPGTVGSPLPRVRLRLTGDGEVLVAGPTVAPGHADSDGWLHTGDLGRQDADGHLWITGRASDRIISGGVNVDPREVESVLLTHPELQDVAVVGIPDRVWGERVVAAVVPRSPSTITSEELAAWSRRVLSAAQRPRDLRIVDRLPLNPNGKADRAQVRALFR